MTKTHLTLLLAVFLLVMLVGCAGKLSPLEKLQIAQLDALWETIGNGYARVPVPGGWVVGSGIYGGACYVPDARHEWTLPAP